MITQPVPPNISNRKNQLLAYYLLLKTKKPDYLKEGLLEYLKQGPRNLDECVLEGAEILKRTGYKGPLGSDDFRIRVYDKLSQLKAVGFITKDRTTSPHQYRATDTGK